MAQDAAGKKLCGPRPIGRSFSPRGSGRDWFPCSPSNRWRGDSAPPVRPALTAEEVMTWFNWFRREPVRIPPRRFQPALETLEERAVPATLSLDRLTVSAMTNPRASAETITRRPIFSTATGAPRLMISGSLGGEFNYDPTGAEITIQGRFDTRIVFNETERILERKIHVITATALEHAGPASTWEITGAAAGTLGQVRFDGVRDLSTTGSDRFVFRPGGSVPGNLTVTGAPDAVLDCSPRTDRVLVDLGPVGPTPVGPTRVVGGMVSGIHTVIGGTNNDVLRGDEFANVFRGGGGNDLLRGGGGDDELYGQGGRDVLMGDGGDDDLFGQGAPDLLVGGVGADFLDGGLRPDIVISGTTSFDNAPDVLAALLEAWFARESLTKEQRIAALTAGIPFDGFTVKLATTTVFNDTFVDGLMNSNGE